MNFPETGVGKIQKGEGSINLARGFSYAGANNLLVSLWNINDLSTATLMGEFYSQLSNTKSPFTANHNAKRSYLNNPNIANPKKSPYYWSSFVYFGSITPTHQTINHNSNIYVYITLIIAIIVVLLYLKKPQWIP